MKENYEEIAKQVKQESYLDNMTDSKQDYESRSLQRILEPNPAEALEKGDYKKKQLAAQLEETREMVRSYMPKPLKKTLWFRNKEGNKDKDVYMEINGNYGPAFSQIPDDLAKVIQVMVEDTSYGPRYKKVRAAANAYLNIVNKKDQANGNDEDAAKALGALYAASIEYLMNRNESSKSTRKNNCEFLAYQIEEYFVRSCNANYLEALTGELNKKEKDYSKKKDAKKTDLYKAHMDSLYETLESEYGTKSNKEIVALKKKNAQIIATNRADKKETLKTIPTVRDIKRMVDGLESMKKFNLPKYVKPEQEEGEEEIDYFERVEKADQEYERELASAGLMLTVNYNRLIETINSYLDYAKNKNEPYDLRNQEAEELRRKYGGKIQKADIPFETDRYEKLLEELKSEMHTINSCITEFVANHRDQVEENDKSFNWGQIINERNKVVLEIDEKSKNVGAGTSDVYVVQRSQEKKQFCKPDEILEENQYEIWKNMYAEIKQSKDYKPEYKETLAQLDKLMKNTVLDGIKNAPESKIEALEDRTYVDMIYVSHHYTDYRGRKSNNVFLDAMDPDVNINVIKRDIQDNRARSDLYDFLETLRSDTDQDKKFFIADILKEYCKKINTLEFGKNLLGLKPGVSMANRNVATSRMAELLHLSHMVPKSEMAKVKVFGKEKVQLLMDEAKGKDIDYDCRGKLYSTKGVMSVINMMVLDNINGQVDRNRGNYFVTLSDDEKTVDGCLLIDNDMSHGTKQGKDSIKKKVAEKVALTEDEILAMSPELRKDILAIDTKNLGAFFNDILDTRAIIKFAERIEEVQRMVREAEDEIKEGLKSVSDARRFHYYLLSHSEDYRANWYLTRLESKKLDNKGFTVDGNTYFSEASIDFGDASFQIDLIKEEYRDDYEEWKSQH